MKKNNFKLYEAFNKKRININKRVMDDYVDNGVAYIPCRVRSKKDIISPFGIRDFETLEPSFVDYIEENEEVIPPEYPLVLSICGVEFSDREKKVIEETIQEYFDYKFGIEEKTYKKDFRIFFAFTIGLILFAVLISFWPWNQDNVFYEFSFILFWFCADGFINYFFFEANSNIKQHLHAARLASMLVEFSKKYDASDLTDEEADEIYEKVYEKSEQNDDEDE